jgi:hypothetical protein
MPANENHAHGYFSENMVALTLCTCGWDDCHPEAVNLKLSASTHIRMANAAARKTNDKLTAELIAAFAEKGWGDDHKWLNYAAAHFCNLREGSLRDKALAVLRYFEKTDYRPTTSVREIVSITLRAAS